MPDIERRAQEHVEQLIAGNYWSVKDTTAIIRELLAERAKRPTRALLDIELDLHAVISDLFTEIGRLREQLRATSDAVDPQVTDRGKPTTRED